MATRRRQQGSWRELVRLETGDVAARICAGILAALLGLPPRSLGITIDQLGPEKELRVEDVQISGNDAFSDGRLEGVIQTHTRAWYAPWRPRPRFDVYTFREDLDRLKRFYESEGFYEAEIHHDLEVEDDRVTVKIRIDENERVKVGGVEVSLAEAPGEPQALPEKLPLKSGDPFREDDYQAEEATLKRFYLEHSYAFVQMKRHATVDLAKDLAQVRYVVDRGERTSFGSIRVEGTESVDPEIVRRELEFERGDPFSLAKIRRSRKNLLALQLFGTVQFDWKRDSADPSLADTTVRVAEKPPREIRAGIGYGTEDEFRAQLRWADHNWFGGARQLSITGQYSTITNALAASFTQPHFPDHDTAAVLPFRQTQEKEDTYDLLASRTTPHFERTFGPDLTGKLGWGAEYASLSGIDAATGRALGGVRRAGFLSGPSLALVWNTTDDPLQPKSGHVLTLQANQRGVIWGGDYDFYKLTGEGKQYWSLGAETILATRLEIGLGDTLGGAADFPIFERYYAGGQTSVRGFGRRRLGPKSASDRPLGGLSLVEGSVELRRPIWGNFGGVAFLDFGQVSLHAYDPPLDDVKFSAGPGFTYHTPVGPLSLYVGFPFDPPRGDAAWQVHFSIGEFF